MGFVDRRQTNIACELQAPLSAKKKIAAAVRQLVGVYQMELDSDLTDKHFQLFG